MNAWQAAAANSNRPFGRVMYMNSPHTRIISGVDPNRCGRPTQESNERTEMTKYVSDTGLIKRKRAACFSMYMIHPPL